MAGWGWWEPWQWQGKNLRKLDFHIGSDQALLVSNITKVAKSMDNNSSQTFGDQHVYSLVQPFQGTGLYV